MTDKQAAEEVLSQEAEDRIGVCLAGLDPQDRDIPSLCDTLERAFVSGGIDLLDSPDTARLTVVPVQAPTEDLARALQMGTPPDVALAGWMSRIGELLALCRRHRRRVLVLAAGPLAAGGAESLDVLTARLGLERAARALPVAEEEAELAPLHLLLARVLLASAPEAQAQADELSAIMAGPGGAAAPDLELIDRSWREARHRDARLAEAQKVLDTEISQKRRDLKLVEADLTQARERADVATEQAQLLHENLAQTVALSAQLEERLNLREAELAELRQTAEEYIALMAEAERDLKAHQGELRQLQARLTASEAAQAESQGVAKRTAEDLRKTKALISERDAAIAELETEKTQSQAGAKQAAKELRKAKALISTRDETIAGLEAEKAELTSAGRAQQATLTQTRQDLRALMEERDLLTASLEDMLAEAAHLEQQAEILQSRIGDTQLLRALNGSLERQIETGLAERHLREAVLGQVILDAETQLRDANAWQAGHLQETVAQYEARLAEQAQVLHDVQARLAEQETALQSARTQLSDQEKAANQERAEQARQIEEMSAELTKIYGSKSWRVTEPMRKARSQLPKKKP